MSFVRRVGKWEVERDMTERKVFISDLNGNLLATFDFDGNPLDLIEWVQENQK